MLIAVPAFADACSDFRAALRIREAIADALEEIAALVRCHLEPGTVVVSDALACFAAVKHVGCTHQPFVTRSGPASARHPALTWVNTLLGNIKRRFHGTSHHLSSKHLPRFLAEFSYRSNRRFSLGEMFPRLASVALRTALPSSSCLSKYCAMGETLNYWGGRWSVGGNSATFADSTRGCLS